MCYCLWKLSSCWSSYVPLDSVSDASSSSADTRKLFAATRTFRHFSVLPLITLYLLLSSTVLLQLNRFRSRDLLFRTFLDSRWDEPGFSHVLAVSLGIKHRPFAYPWCSPVCRLWLAAAYCAVYQFKKMSSTLLTYLLTYILTYLLTLYSRVSLAKLTGSQLVNKFPAFYGTRRFITAFTSARHLSLFWASSIQFIPLHPTSWTSILILSSHLPSYK